MLCNVHHCGYRKLAICTIVNTEERCIMQIYIIHVWS